MLTLRMDKAEALKQLDETITVAERASEPGSEFRRDTADEIKALTLCVSTVERLAPAGSNYRAQTALAVAGKGYTLRYWLSHVLGTTRGLRSDIDAGYLTTIEEEAHADVFADLSEMSDHLVGSSMLLPAAVVSGAALEAHLRAMASKAGIATSSGGKPKRAGKLNDDLKAKGVYKNADHKQVIAWQGIRNDAAHGHGQPAKSQVQNMTQGIRDFIALHPA